MGRWGNLAAEIRLMILEMVLEGYSFKSEPYARARYASVCREWQPVFEQRNFQRLVLDQARIYGLEEFMGKEATSHRRDYLKHLFLRVRLDEYDCTVCQSKEDNETIKNNNGIFSKAVWNLLIILSKWTRSACSRGRGGRQQGLTLELGAYSPSDSKHTFRDFRLEHDYPYQERNDLEMDWDTYKLRADRLGLDSLNDLYHRWVDGHRDRLSLESKQRIMGTLTIDLDLPEFSAFSHIFPKVEIITGLLIRRQFYRKIAIWNGGEGHACLFRYEYSNDVGKPQITWASNWGINVQLDYDVVQCWADLPKHRHLPHGNLTTAVDRIPRRFKQVKTFATAIRYLKLRGTVLDLMSDYQLSWEQHNP
ncbi:Uncharacterized protein BP5553_07021 [Venustampulla echinocandica]|uniref:DUF6546 domain-containing protein n=1 Tax=Venustampulla echinocandica TaxID=2656787 RepID=A0A370TIB6_9HELO|nr:Uncharacterized protein BP5553_07021 [Venustampulla echinocandica]RDL35090.1 Uncharacterized protein BP5553_07021 [Venustampulla echinocandica]